MIRTRLPNRLDLHSVAAQGVCGEDLEEGRGKRDEGSEKRKGGKRDKKRGKSERIPRSIETVFLKRAKNYDICSYSHILSETQSLEFSHASLPFNNRGK